MSTTRISTDAAFVFQNYNCTLTDIIYTMFGKVTFLLQWSNEN